jgi:hypothetical protein
MTSSHSNGQRDDMPITLAQAAEMFNVGVGSLQAEAERGRLTIYRIGGRVRTTVNDMRAMLESCRVEPKAHDFTSISREVRRANTSSATADASCASAQQAMLKLRNSSRNTSPASTAPRHQRVR